MALKKVPWHSECFPIWPQHLFSNVPLWIPCPRGTTSSSFYNNLNQHSFIHSFVQYCLGTYYVHTQVLRSVLTQAQMPFTFSVPRGITIVFTCLAATTPSSGNGTSVFLWGATAPLLSGLMGLGELTPTLGPMVRLWPWPGLWDHQIHQPKWLADSGMSPGPN